MLTGQTPGVYDIRAYAFSTATGTFNQERVVTVTLTANPRMAVDVPNTPQALQPFLLGGWAIDLAAASGTGVNTVHIWARRLEGGEDQFIDAATYGVTRSDVGAAFGSQFTQSGYEHVITGLPPGTYRFTVFAYSLIANGFNQAMQFDVAVDPVVATPVLSVASGTYFAEFSVQASTSTPSATMRYTTDGTEPTATSPTTMPLVDASMTVKAKAFRAGWLPSASTSAAYVLEATAPAFSVPAGAFTANFSVTVTSPTPSTEVRYTTDGTDPTATSALLSGPQYLVNSTVTLKVKAFRSGWTPSGTTSAKWRNKW